MNKKQIKDNVTFKFSENRVNICMWAVSKYTTSIV